MIIQPFPLGPFETNAYVVSCPETLEAVIIDPAETSASVVAKYIVKHHLKPKKILLTHSHWDHIVDVAELKEMYNIPVYIHNEDAANLQSPGADGMPSWIPITGVKPDHFLVEGEVLHFGKINLKVIHTPGHTPGGVCYYCEKEGVLFSGDTLFRGSIGNLSFPTARPELMWKSLAKLAELPPETCVYPGHGESTTIEAEKWLSRAEEIFG